MEDKCRAQNAACAPLSSTVMRRRAVLPLLAVLLSCATTLVPPGRSVALPASGSDALLNLCSRSGPSAVEGLWDVPTDVVAALEHDLHKLSRLKATGCCLLGGKIRNPEEYFRHYLGLVVGGKRVVYINAFKSAAAHPRWQAAPVGVCDGGSDYWGALCTSRPRGGSTTLRSTVSRRPHKQLVSAAAGLRPLAAELMIR